jgi:hypothetical protein
MNPEVPTRTTTQQSVLMPRINSPFQAHNFQAHNLPAHHLAAHNLQPCQTALPAHLAGMPPKVFPSTHMQSPWNTAHYMQAAPITQTPTGWGTSALPPVDIEVLAEPSPATAENTKITWTSAEQLADAIFPTDAENIANSIEPMHHGLMNHKMEIEKLHVTAEKLESMLAKQQRCTSTHQMLHSAHEAKHASLKSDIKNTQESAAAVDTVTKNNSATLKQHADSLQEMKEQQKNHYAGLLNHRDTLRDLQDTQKTLKSKAERQEESLLSMQRSIADIKNNLQQSQITPQRLSNLHERTQMLEANMQTHSAKMNSLVSANNAINANLASLQAQACNDRQVQFQVLAPRSRR